MNNNITDLTHMKEDIRCTAERCAEIFIEYSEKRKQVTDFIMCHLLKLGQEMFYNIYFEFTFDIIVSIFSAKYYIVNRLIHILF